MTRRLAIVAGGGSLVPEAVARAKSKGWAVLVLAAIPRPDLEAVEVKPLDLSKPLSAIAAVRKFAATDIVLVGGLHVPDAAREKLAGVFARKGAPKAPTGDSGLSRYAGGIKLLSGARLMGIHELLPELLAAEGIMAGPRPGGKAMGHCRFAFGIARKIGALDVGQAVVCAGERIIAVEDIAGTDALLDRVAGYRARGLAGDGKAPLVLAKAVKPGQALKVDLPAIGPVTIERAAAAGIAVVVVEAGLTLLVDRTDLLAEAEKRGISLVGLKPEGRS